MVISVLSGRTMDGLVTAALIWTLICSRIIAVWIVVFFSHFRCYFVGQWCFFHAQHTVSEVFFRQFVVFLSYFVAPLFLELPKKRRKELCMLGHLSVLYRGHRVRGLGIGWKRAHLLHTFCLVSTLVFGKRTKPALCKQDLREHIGRALLF